MLFNKHFRNCFRSCNHISGVDRQRYTISFKTFSRFFNTVLECVARRDTQCQRERCTIYAIIFATPERKNYTASIKFETVQIEISGRNTLRERPLYQQKNVSINFSNSKKKHVRHPCVNTHSFKLKCSTTSSIKHWNYW